MLYRRIIDLLRRVQKSKFKIIKIDDVADAATFAKKLSTGFPVEVTYHPVGHLNELGAILELTEEDRSLIRENSKRPANIEGCYSDDRVLVANIYYRHRETYCWERFSKCKELCQLALSQEKTSISTMDEVENFIRVMAAPYRILNTTDERIAEAVKEDYLGIKVAIEVLFPLEERIWFMNRIRDEAFMKNFGQAFMGDIRKKIIEQSEEGSLCHDALEALAKGLPTPMTVDDERIVPNDPMDLIALLYRIPRRYVAEAGLEPRYNAEMLISARAADPIKYGKLRINF